jgi:hypothetical protein
MVILPKLETGMRPPEENKLRSTESADTQF